LLGVLLGVTEIVGVLLGVTEIVTEMLRVTEMVGVTEMVALGDGVGDVCATTPAGCSSAIANATTTARDAPRDASR
jgi:hypothetical protein